MTQLMSKKVRYTARGKILIATTFAFQMATKITELVNKA